MTVDLVRDEPRGVDERLDEIEAALRVLLSQPVDPAPAALSVSTDDLVLVVAGAFALLALVLALKL